jgi:hypothetical protein
MSAADGRFDEPVESVTASIPLAEFTSGDQLLYISSRDELGHWGLSSSIFINIEALKSRPTYIPLAVDTP